MLFLNLQKGLRVRRVIASALIVLAASPSPAQLVARDGEIVETVTRVYDGDTITMARRLEPYGLKISVRLVGIDTPEIKGAKCKAEKAAGVAARDYLRGILAEGGNQFILRPRGKSITWDRNGGRIDGRVIIWRNNQEQDAALLLMNAGHGVAYDGHRARKGGWCTLLKRKR